jgi:YrbI family 3-deoxy-D-manno-octulosonate 8-phosphate phosphatase
MNRVELELLILAVPNISRERESRAKARLMEQEFRPFLLGCEKDLNSITLQFREMDQSIQKFYRIQTNRKRAARIKALLVDSNTLLDGGEYHSTAGETFMRFSTRDRDGITKLRDRGVLTLLVNPQANPIIDTVAIKWGMEIIPGVSDVEQMISAVREKYALTLIEIACIFNDLKDLSRLKDVGLSLTAGDAPLDLRRRVDHVLSAKGGQGVIEEIAELFIEDRVAIRF